MPSTDDLRSLVATYVETVGTANAAAIAALYAEDGTLEDPIGTEPHVGRAAVEKFYSALEGATMSTELLTVRAGANTAAFHFRVATDTGEQTVTIEPIDVMTFNDDGLITSMRAIWSEDDMSMS